MRHKRVEKKDYLRNRCLIQQTLRENYLFYLQYRDVFTIYHDNTCIFFIVFLKYLSVPNSNFPGPFLRKLPLIQGGIVPSMVVGMGSGVSSAERTRGAKHSSPLACGHLCLLDTEGGEKKHWKAGKAHYSIHCVLYYWSYAHRGSLVGNMLLHTCIS